MQIKRYLIGAAAASSLGLLPMLNTEPAQAIGCLTGAAAGAAVGHFAHHHAILGAIGGCIYGRHMRHKKEEEERRRAANGNPQ